MYKIYRAVPWREYGAGHYHSADIITGFLITARQSVSQTLQILFGTYYFNAWAGQSPL